MSRNQKHRLALSKILHTALRLRCDFEYSQSSYVLGSLDDEIARRIQMLGGMLGEW